MKKHLNTTIIAGLFLILYYQLPAQTLQPSSSPYLDSCFLAEIESQNIPGISACITKGGQIRWIGAYGYAYLEPEIPVDTSTLFMLASVSKTITVTALMQLWEQGLFGLDDTINNYLPFEVRHPVDSLVPITFRMLCTHTSSIRDNSGLMPNYFGGDSPIPLGEYLFDYLNPEGANYYQYDNFYYYQPPGTDYHYSNIGCALIGYLVEVIGDSTFSYQTKERIFEPLQMNETEWFLSDLDTMHVAMPYTASNTPYWHYGTSWYPSCQLRTSVDQLANFLLCYMNGGTHLGQQILHDSTVQEILTPQVPIIHPDVGLIWNRGMGSNNTIWWGHTGSYLGITTVMGFCPEDDYGYIILTNKRYVNYQPLATILYNYAQDSIIITSVPLYYSDQNTVINNIWPNPISEKATILYTLKQPGNITLQILNIKGLEVKTLVNEKKLAGEYIIQIDILDLPAGVYFCVLKTSEGIQTKKIIKL